MPAYSPASIANYFLDRASQEGRALTPMQLLKLVYMAHGWYLGYTGEPLINEQVQAWRHGPVIKSLYDRIRHFGSGAVMGLVVDNPFGSLPTPVGPETTPLLDSVWRNYARFSGIELSELTHQKGTPWWTAWYDQGGQSKYFAPISNDLIRAHYVEKINASTTG